MKRLLARLFPGARGSNPGQMLSDSAAVIWAVGDVHGRHDLYRQLEDRIAADPATDKLLILLGDMIDRGPDSAALLDHLTAAPPAGLRRVCLLGNHEAMALQFLSDPDPAADWLRHGGREFLASYGLRLTDAAAGGSRRSLAQAVAAHVPQDHIDFLARLPVCLRAGGLVFVHAGVDPARPLSDQSRDDMIWTRNYRDTDLPAPSDLPPGGLVVHGHMPVEAVARRGWRLNLDSGAWATGRLTAARFAAGAEPELHSVAA